MTWRKRIVDEHVPAVEAALQGEVVEAISFDFANGLVAVTVPENTDEGAADAIVAKARSATKAGAYVRRPPEYPFALHLRGPVKPITPARLADRVAEVSVRLRDVLSCQDVYEEVSRRAATHDFVATFALGGLVPLQFVARIERGNRTHDAFVRDLRDLQRKYHLFAGLLWEGEHGPKAFRGWLDGLPERSRVLIFDTTFTGNAVNRIWNVVSAHIDEGAVLPELEIEIVGVLDSSRGKAPPAQQVTLTTKAGRRVRISSEVLEVTNLVTEDRIELVGYDSLRTIGGISAQWSSAVVIVEDDDGRTVQVIGTRSLATTFGELLDGRIRPVTIDQPMVAMSQALAVGSAISMAARQERHEVQQALRKGLVTSEEYDQEMLRISAAEKGARKRYKRYFDAVDNGDDDGKAD